MNEDRKSSRVLIRNLVFLVAWAALFTLAYAQAPLYTSNQNQYFLHGFAKAGYGYLNEDWLANTLDPTPVFSRLIEVSWRVLPWRPVFYPYFGILAGVFLFSLLGIADGIWGVGKSRSQKVFYLASLTTLFSAGVGYLTARLLGVNWEFPFDGGVAGQRLLGSVFQPSTFGVFLLLSIYLFLREKRWWAIICLLVSATFHPTYLLSAGILTALYMGITFWETRDLRHSLALGLGASIGVSPILWHTLSTFGGSKPMLTAQARNILATFRIPHHAIVAEWLDASVLFKLLFIGLALIILWKGHATGSQNSPNARKKLFHIILWPALIAILLTIVQAFSQNVTLALLFPWRLSTWLVPLSVGVIMGWTVRWVFQHFQLQRYPRSIVVISLIASITFAAIGVAKFRIMWQDKQALDDRRVTAYVEANKRPGETYLIPLKMQDFRLESGAPAYIEFKSIPYKNEDLIEWRRRVNLVRKIYNQVRCKKISEYGEEEGFTHLVLPASHGAIQCEQVEAVYQDEDYGVFKIIGP